MSQTAHWIEISTQDALIAAGGRQVVKKDGKQVLLIETDQGLIACNNRCPHEGYPLSEGSLTGATLTCNWHNWKFDLASGETLVGGDCLRRYPVENRGGAIWADLSDPPAEETAARARTNLRESFDDYDYTRIARELARLHKATGSTDEAIRRAIQWTHDHLEYGMTHAFGGAVDWLTLSEDYAAGDTDRLGVALETCAHMAWDGLRWPAFPYTEDRTPYDAGALVAAIEAEDETRAIALVRDALATGLTYATLRPALARAALAHYADFGHAAIYTYKTGQLIERLGPDVTEPLVLSLVRMLIYARREDLLPEFRGYADAIARWSGDGQAHVTPMDFLGLGPKGTLEATLTASGNIPALYDALLGAAAENLLHFDEAYDRHTDKPVSQNIGWLDFTHAITFANAIRHLCTETPDLWPQGLLQMALFVGRNAAYVTPLSDEHKWLVGNHDMLWQDTARNLFDHGEFRHILAVHKVKMMMAVREECAAAPDAPWVPALLAAFNRFVNAPMRTRHMKRTAQQALSFVASEG